MRTVRWLAWSAGILFLLGTALQFVDTLNLYATPPVVSDALNIVEAPARHPGLPDRDLADLLPGQPELWRGVRRARRTRPRAGLDARDRQFAAGRHHDELRRRWSPRGRRPARPHRGPQVTIDLSYCDCGFKETEIVSQIWAQMLANGASAWLVNGATVLAAIGVVAADLHSAAGCRARGTSFRG